jgi:hypothetical protein
MRRARLEANVPEIAPGAAGTSFAASGESGVELDAISPILVQRVRGRIIPSR